MFLNVLRTAQSICVISQLTRTINQPINKWVSDIYILEMGPYVQLFQFAVWIFVGSKCLS